MGKIVPPAATAEERASGMISTNASERIVAVAKLSE
jgi:hypothetical protein